jgi:hypothetical protein
MRNVAEREEEPPLRNRAPHRINPERSATGVVVLRVLAEDRTLVVGAEKHVRAGQEVMFAFGGGA